MPKAATKNILLMILIVAAMGCGAHKSITLHRIKCDLDNDGCVEIVSITSLKKVNTHPVGGDIIVSNAHGKVMWRQTKLNPWKLQTGDVNGDGKTEIAVGVWKKSPKDAVMAKRTFIYSWNGKRLMPMWLGSRLSRRFDDFALADIDHDKESELVALEIAPSKMRSIFVPIVANTTALRSSRESVHATIPKKQHRISVYRWKSFGFEWLGCSNDVQGISSLKSDGKTVKAICGNAILQVLFADGKVKFITRGKADG